MQRVLVTGGFGTLGTALQILAPQFPTKEFVFIGRSECDLADSASVACLLREVQPAAVLHFAAKSGGIHYSTDYPATLLRDNVLMVFTLLDAMRQIPSVQKIVMCLSSGVYPANAPSPLIEEYIHQGEAHASNYSYAYAKRLMDTAIKAYRKEYGLSAVGLIPNGIIGENANFQWDSAVMPCALIRRFYENRHTNAPLVVWGDGTPMREISYAGDIARAFVWALDHYNDEQVLNIGTTEAVSVRDTAVIIAEELDIDPKRIVFDTSKPTGHPGRKTDNSRFVKLSNFQYTSYRETLRHTIHYFVENYNQPGKVRL